MADETGEEFFRVLVGHLSELLGMSHSFLSCISEPDRDQLEVVAAWSSHGQDFTGISYDIVGTPCEIVLRDGSYCHPSGIQKRFAGDTFLSEINAESYLGVALKNAQGEPMGLLSVFGEQPILDPEYAASIVKVFASRAASEYRRIMAESNMSTDLRDTVNSEIMLRRELNHRVRNNLSALLSLINLTRIYARDTNDFAAAISERVQAMADVHSLLSESKDHGSTMAGICETLLPTVQKDRIRINIHDVPVMTQQATAVAIVLHELITNSQKYGVLSSAEGHIDLTCRMISEEEEGVVVELEWFEQDGPGINTPPEPGLGTQIIEGLVHSDLRGQAKLAYPPEGVRHVLRMLLTSSKASLHALSPEK